MSEIRFRLAKPSDAKQIANCHWHVRDRYSQGIFLSLGERFLRAYYSIMLNDPWEVVVCAEDETGKIVGFSSSTLDAEKQARNLRKHRVRLALAALSSVIIHPHLIKPLLQRYKSLSNSKNAPKFIHLEGVRGEYWCWMKSDKASGLQSIDMENIKDGIIYNLGYKEIFFEVDKFNSSVLRYHEKVAKAERISEIVLPDGRERVLFKKLLKQYRKLGV